MQMKLIVACLTILAGVQGLHLSSGTTHSLQSQDHEFIPIIIEGIIAAGAAIFDGLTVGEAVVATATTV
jgi:DNA/RNA endonuclease YhcR with UshA esterase domain